MSRRPPVLLILVAIGLAPTGCGTTTERGAGASAPAGGAPLDLRAQNSAFSPSTLTLAAGGGVTLTLHNLDSATHSFTADSVSADITVAGGSTGVVTFTAPASGSISFHCRFHPRMTGTIGVGPNAGGAGSAATPAASGSSAGGGYGSH